MMCLLPLPYIARANTVPVAKKNATIDDRLALLVIGFSENGIFDVIFDDLADALSI